MHDSSGEGRCRRCESAGRRIFARGQGQQPQAFEVMLPVIWHLLSSEVLKSCCDSGLLASLQQFRCFGSFSWVDRHAASMCDTLPLRIVRASELSCECC